MYLWEKKPEILVYISLVNTELNEKSKGCQITECQLQATECQDGFF